MFKKPLKTILIVAIFSVVATAIYFTFFSQAGIAKKYAVLGKIEKGDVESQISASGQVSNADEVDLEFEASGIIENIYVEEGSYVKAGQIIAQMDATDANMAIRNAEIALEQEELNLEELSEPADEIDVKKAQNALTVAQNSLTDLTSNYNSDYADKEDEIASLETDLPDTYNSAYNAVAEIFITLPDALDAIDELINGHDFASNQSNLSFYNNETGRQTAIESKIDNIKNSYNEAKSSYKKALEAYQNTDGDNVDNIKTLADETYNAVRQASETLKELDVFLALVAEELDSGIYDEILSSERSEVSSYSSQINLLMASIYDEIENINNKIKSIEAAKDDLITLTSDYESAVKSAEITVEEKTLDLEELQTSSVTALDIKAEQLKVEQKESDLLSAQKDYEGYFIYAPIAGYISGVDIDIGEHVSLGTTVATLIDNSPQIIVPLNELDILNIEVGQEAIITFSAIEDFSANGTVVEKSITGDVNSGVVSYNVTVSINSDDERILNGMSADLTLILKLKEDVILVTASAVKEDKDGKYVEVVTNADEFTENSFYDPAGLETEKQYIETGEEDDLNYEVVSGLTEGETIVLMTASIETDSTDTAGINLFGSGSGARSGGEMPSGPPSGMMPGQ
ncbi:MAG: HlyD family efflux transporter periplasmic adaptor subunit [Candidatus Gracilibacteria bacterium]|jgi:HlyD family secretion protein